MIEQYSKHNKTIQYEIIFKPIKHVYFRKKDDYIIITANKKMSKNQVLSIIDNNFEKLIYMQTKKNRHEAERYQLWGEKLSKDQFYQTKEANQANYERILIDETYKQIKAFESRLITDLKKINLSLKPTKVKRLKSKFGSCQIIKKEITINAFLARLEPVFLYYVLLHEYCHLIVPNHSKSFYDLLDQLMPQHKTVQKMLRKYVITF